MYHTLKNVLTWKLKLLMKHTTSSASVSAGLFNICLYFIRSSLQTKKEFDNFNKNFELNLEHIVNRCLFLTAVLDDFDTRMQGWYQKDMVFEWSKFNRTSSQLNLN